MALRFIANRRREHWLIYNAPPLYWLPILLIRRHNRTLLLADGINCAMLPWAPAIYRRVFARFVLLTSRSAKYLGVTGDRYVLLNGVASTTGAKRSQGNRPDEGQGVLLLYNSAPLPHNGGDIVSTLVLNGVRVLSTTNIGSTNEAIQYLGYLSDQEYETVLGTVTAVLIARDPDRFENEFNFPSKIIEAAERGVSIVSLFPIEDLPKGAYLLWEERSLGSAFVLALRRHVEAGAGGAVLKHLSWQLKEAKAFLSA